MNWNNKERTRFLQAILALATTNEAKRFLRDLMTEKEIDEFAKRLKAAEMLIKKASYTLIEKETGLSSTTIARVSKWLNGKEGGYKIILRRLHHHYSPKTRRGLL